ncbi:MAG: hypothetical protein ACI83B_002777 [Sediminicola sp.]|jgi:hypothetical protein
MNDHPKELLTQLFFGSLRPTLTFQLSAAKHLR